MSKDNSTKQVKRALKLIEKLEKLKEDMAAKPPAAPVSAAVKKKVGMVEAPELLHQSVSERFYRDYNHRLPLTLLVKYAMDAIDAGKITVPPVHEVMRELAEMIGGPPLTPTDPRSVEVVTERMILTPDMVKNNTMPDGTPMPDEVREVIRRLIAEDQNKPTVSGGFEPFIFPEPNTKTEANDNVIRFQKTEGDEDDE